MFGFFSTNMSSSTVINFVSSSEQFERIPTIQEEAFKYLKSAEKAANKVRFIFVRHGQTPTNASGGLPGSRTSHDPLTEEGRKQAINCGKALTETNIHYDAFYRSPTVRTKETMTCIQAQLGTMLESKEDERLHEKDHGRYEKYGVYLSKEQLEKLKEENAKIKEKEIANNTGPSKTFLEKFSYSADSEEIESLAGIYARVSEFLKEVYKAHRDQPEHPVQDCLVVSHYGVLKALFMEDAFKRGFDIDYRAHDIKNCGVVVVEVDDEGMHIVATNGLAFTGNKFKT